MKFLSLAGWTSIIETGLFAEAYRRDGLASVCQFSLGEGVRQQVLQIARFSWPIEKLVARTGIEPVFQP